MYANYTCYCCEAAYHHPNHHCNRECHVEGQEVIHYDFCRRCRKLMIYNFIGQMSRPKLRIEGKT